MNVRAATLTDFDALIALGHMMHAESTNAFPAIEPERFRTHLMLAQERPDLVLIAVADTGRNVIGMVTAVAGDYVFSRERRAVGDLLFVHPQHRRWSTARALLDRFEAWGKEVGARQALLGSTTGVDPSGFARLLGRHGYTSRGTVYAKEIA